MSDAPKAPAGWFRDDADPTKERYWDGQKWTDAYRPAQPAPAPLSEQASDEDRTLLQSLTSGDTPMVIQAGYAFALIMPIVGFVIGVSQINRSADGLRIVVASILGAIVWAAALANQGV